MHKCAVIALQCVTPFSDWGESGELSEPDEGAKRDIAKRKSGKQRQAIRRRNESKQAALAAARPRRAPPPCDYCGKPHEGDCPGPWCPICDDPLPPVIHRPTGHVRPRLVPAGEAATDDQGARRALPGAATRARRPDRICISRLIASAIALAWSARFYPIGLFAGPTVRRDEGRLSRGFPRRTLGEERVAGEREGSGREGEGCSGGFLEASRRDRERRPEAWNGSDRVEIQGVSGGERHAQGAGRRGGGLAGGPARTGIDLASPSKLYKSSKFLWGISTAYTVGNIFHFSYFIYSSENLYIYSEVT